MTTDLQEYARRFLQEKAAKTDAALHACVDAWTDAPPGLREAMAYSLFAGGKRLRPALVLGATALCGGREEDALPAACAVEMLHTFSLVHDDLPCMDNDALRRGKPTCHVRFGEATALLAGDALVIMAFATAAKCGRADVVAELASAAGVQGMTGGQFLDMTEEGEPKDLDSLRRLHAMKTGALIRASVCMGARIAGCDAAALAALTAYGEHIGLAFQIVDDILDITGDEARLGKPVGSDQANEKVTYPALVGLEGARDMAREAIDHAIKALESFGPKADAFRALASFILERDR